MKKLISLILLAMMFTAGCDLAGINLTPVTQSAAISSFGVSPPSIAAGESSTLSWAVSGATTASIDHGIGNVALTGSRVVMPAATTVYTLTAFNAAGLSVTATAQVIVSGGTTPTPTPSPTPGSLPVINYFTATPSGILAGASSTLTWNVSNATSITIDQGVGPVGASGTIPVLPTTTTNYTLTAVNSTGTSYKSTMVVVFTAPSFTVTGVTASANPSSFSGSCPVTANFFATITASGPGMVTYRWERSDGTAEPTQSMTFSAAGPQIVGTSWQLGASGTYWERIHVYTPNETISNQASFALSCAPTPTGIWSGTWETTYGTMVLTQTGSNVSGTYEHSNGYIVGTVSGNVLYGTWSEAPTYSAPDHAGDVQLTLSTYGVTFTGGWRYGSSGSWTMNWNGTKIF